MDARYDRSQRGITAQAAIRRRSTGRSRTASSIPAGEAGWYLQRERERRGETLEQASEATGIHPYHLEAIESGDLTRLPQRLEALEMVGIYAQHMGFEPEPLVSTMRSSCRARGGAGSRPSGQSGAVVERQGHQVRQACRGCPKFSIRNFPGGTGGIVASCLGAILLFAGASWMMQPSPDMLRILSRSPHGERSNADRFDGSEAADVKVTESPMPTISRQRSCPAGRRRWASSPCRRSDAAGASLDGLTDLIEETVGEAAAGDQADAAARADRLGRKVDRSTPEGPDVGSDNEARASCSRPRHRCGSASRMRRAMW